MRCYIVALPLIFNQIFVRKGLTYLRLKKHIVVYKLLVFFPSILLLNLNIKPENKSAFIFISIKLRKI